MFVEADFDHDPPYVTLRVYKVEDGERQLLQTQELYNRLQRRPAADDAPGVHADHSLLVDLGKWLSKGSVIKANLKVLKISRQEFDGLARKWKSLPGVLIDRKSQASLGDLPEAKLEIDLSCRAAITTMTAFIRAGAGRTPYHAVGVDIIRDRRQVRIDGSMYRFAPPLDWTLLATLFGKGPREVASLALNQNLAVIINRNFQLLTGDVRHTRLTEAIAIQIDADGDDVIVTARCGTAPIAAEAALSPSQLFYRGSNFEVATYDSPALEAVRAFLRKEYLRPGDPGRYHTKATAATLQRLRQAVSQLPPAVQVSWAPKLQALAAREIKFETNLHLVPGKGWVDMHLSCRINGVEISADELRRAVDSETPMLRTRDGQWLPIEPERVTQLQSILSALDLGPGSNRVSNLSARAMLQQLDAPNLQVHQQSQAVLAALQNLPDAGEAPLSDAMAACLRPYQRQGTDFLYNRTAYNMGCILADDMGLGKTRQVLAYLSVVAASRPAAALVVCPASVVAVWVREAANLLPDLRVRALVGTPAARQALIERASEFDLFVATYAVVRNDLELLRPYTFAAIILDEAQQIKNPQAQVSRAVRSLKADARIAVTGTPMENRLLDLWSTMEFLNPGFLGAGDDVEQRFAGSHGRARLAARLAPLMLRRTKDQVAPELPPRTDELLEIPMSPSQREAYDAYLTQARAAAQDQGAIAILAALTRLRQISCHPALLDPERDTWSDEAILAGSAKLQVLLEHLRELADEGHCALVFSQFTGMLELIERQMMNLSIETYTITGATPAAKRAELVESFQQSSTPAVFLLSLKAAGTGLTLTRADYVFIFDPWWNPAAENQAIDRTHRIGQDKPVFAYRMAAEDSVETRVLQLQEDKRQLFAELIEGAAPTQANLSAADLAALLG